MEEIIELIMQTRDGNDDAFSTLCDKYSSLIYSMSLKHFAMCVDEFSSKDDFVQEAKMAFYNAVISFDVGNKGVTFGAYAKVCIRNRLISCVRKQLSKKRRKGKEDAQSQELWSLQDTVVRRELGEKLKIIAENTLSGYEKMIFSYFLEGRKAKEISSIIGKSEKSVNNAIYRIKSKLKKTVN